MMRLFTRCKAASRAVLVSAWRPFVLYPTVSVFLVAALSSAQGTQTFTGVIADDQCGRGGHAQMRMGPTDAECTKMCIIAHGAKYVLDDGTNMYVLSDQKLPEAFAAQKVTVTGTLDARTKTIQVDSITAAQ
jgi:hypothetical protein